MAALPAADPPASTFLGTKHHLLACILVRPPREFAAVEQTTKQTSVVPALVILGRLREIPARLRTLIGPSRFLSQTKQNFGLSAPPVLTVMLPLFSLASIWPIPLLLHPRLWHSA